MLLEVILVIVQVHVHWVIGLLGLIVILILYIVIMHNTITPGPTATLASQSFPLNPLKETSSAGCAASSGGIFQYNHLLCCHYFLI